MPVDQLADTIPGMSVNECALIINDTFVDVWKGRSRKGSGLYRLNSDSPCYLPTKWAVDSRRSRRSPAFPLRRSTLGCFVRARSYATTYPR